MKHLSVLAFFFSTLVLGNGLKGEKHLETWLGTYKITKCINCPDVLFESEYAIANAKEFYIGSYKVPNSDLPPCATSNNEIWFDYTFVTSNYSAIETSFFSQFGVCHWGLKQSLKMSENSFTYQLLTSTGKRVTKITKVSESTYKLFQRIEEIDLRYGYPESVEFELELVK